MENTNDTNDMINETEKPKRTRRAPEAPTPPEGFVFTLEAAAKHCGVSIATLRKRIVDGHLGWYAPEETGWTYGELFAIEDLDRVRDMGSLRKGRVASGAPKAVKVPGRRGRPLQMVNPRHRDVEAVAVTSSGYVSEDVEIG
jgi:hypothetical protein